jgi:ABC-type bacteriocin/lantibiotic exporter with double-glycine peptidase domain
LAANSTPFHPGDGPEEGAVGIEPEPVETPTKSNSGLESSDTTLARIASNSRDDNRNIFVNLSSAISESGSNLSQGQRQLLCLARALLKSPRVLLMDEATASIDYATDSKIQETLRELKDNTIITIAHRLQTIIDYDKVLVLDKGEVLEYDDPWELIRKENGFFRGMCQMSGDFDTLMELARKAWEGRRLVDDT